jgi:hypothetical protein
LKTRFDDLPLHRIFHDPEVSLESIEGVLTQNNNDPIMSDAIGLTALYVLACNPRVTSSMFQALIRACPGTELKKSLKGTTAAQLLLDCNGFAADKIVHMTLIDVLKKDVPLTAIEFLTPFNQSFIDYKKIDELANLRPFIITTAFLSNLESTYKLMLFQPDICRPLEQL